MPDRLSDARLSEIRKAHERLGRTSTKDDLGDLLAEVDRLRRMRGPVLTTDEDAATEILRLRNERDNVAAELHRLRAENEAMRNLNIQQARRMTDMHLDRLEDGTTDA